MAEDYKSRTPGALNQTPGQILRAAREAGEFSLFDAEEGTKIPKQLLESIERDEYHKLSGPLYVKSFLRNYAGWLGLDAEQILTVYELATGRPEPTAGRQDEVWSEDQVAVTRVGMAWGRLVGIAVAATVVLVLLVVLALRIFGGGDDEGAEPASPPVSSVQESVPSRQTVVTRTEPEAEETTGTADAPAEPIADPVRSEVQPGDRAESDADRLARLTQDRFGGMAEEVVPAAAPTAEAATPDPVAATPEPQLAPPRRGDSELRFVDGETFPLVLRVFMPEPANCTVRRDEQADAVPVIWPDNPGPMPAYNLRHGLAYAVEGGFAVYWGAEDHFTLTLGRVRDVEVSLNGHAQSLGDWRPGQTKLLDAARLPRGGG